MAIHSFRPLTPSGRFTSLNKQKELSKKRPERALTEHKHKTGGRNAYGRVTSRHRGGGHKQLYRIIDFHRAVLDLPAKVEALEYDPNRSANLALIVYGNGDKRYIIAPVGVGVGAKLMSGPTAPPQVGNCLPLKAIPLSSSIHNIELTPGRGGQMVRSAGGAATLMSRDEGYAQIKLPSGEIRKASEDCYATIGQVGNTEHENVVLGKAGRSRHRGIRPITRGVARNPVDHPNGGGQGKSKGGGGWQQLTSPWGLQAKGYRTRNKQKISNRFIVVRRDGRPMKQK